MKDCNFFDGFNVFDLLGFYILEFVKFIYDNNKKFIF